MSWHANHPYIKKAAIYSNVRCEYAPDASHSVALNIFWGFYRIWTQKQTKLRSLSDCMRLGNREVTLPQAKIVQNDPCTLSTSETAPSCCISITQWTYWEYYILWHLNNATHKQNAIRVFSLYCMWPIKIICAFKCHYLPIMQLVHCVSTSDVAVAVDYFL